MMWRILPGACLLAVAWLTGCQSRPTTDLLTLPLPAAASQPWAARLPSGRAPDAPVLAVRRVGLPEHHQDSQVRYREGTSTVAHWPGVSWADRLDVTLTEHLAMRLRGALPGWTVCVRTCPAAAPTLVLRVDLSPFDVQMPEAMLRAGVHWWLDAPSRPAATASPVDTSPRLDGQGRTMHTIPVVPRTPAGQAAAMAAVLDRLSAEVADAVTPPPITPIPALSP
ncbi:hypothetical protein DEH84_09205 [Aquabacterium olei]|uniref:ABC-type transport auxiliary lipoprotein component domain-containing protein n=1 Tax=Aquabacterium olei TaxID=1296669 RepID=A0A2U8FRF8_9BURK|nr:ABC-type transport auxiliary lipoprotein family protein [Aquabacterium olei]AWI53590.1 hypothetical protein DEH84_09205 [Aquabacterium olei]